MTGMTDWNITCLPQAHVLKFALQLARLFREVSEIGGRTLTEGMGYKRVVSMTVPRSPLEFSWSPDPHE